MRGALSAGVALQPPQAARALRARRVVASGDVVENPMTQVAAGYTSVFNPRMTRNTIYVRIGANVSFAVLNAGDGAYANPTAASWRYRLTVTRDW
jgi:hypothetical protein